MGEVAYLQHNAEPQRGFRKQRSRSQHAITRCTPNRHLPNNMQIHPHPPFPAHQTHGLGRHPVRVWSAYVIGHEINDLPMEFYCPQIASDDTVVASTHHPDNKPLYLISAAGYDF
jgi:hypothetical protein